MSVEGTNVAWKQNEISSSIKFSLGRGIWPSDMRTHLRLGSTARLCLFQPLKLSFSVAVTVETVPGDMQGPQHGDHHG